MANPKSRGIGTGAAQVYDYSRIDNAMRDAFGVVSQKRAAHDKRQQQLDDEKRKAIQQMRGEFGEYDTTKMKRSDVDSLIDMVKKSREQLDGNWDKVLNGDPYYSNLYKEHTMLHNKFIGDSVDAKEKFQNAIKAAEQPDSGFSKDARIRLLDASTTPGVMWDDAVNEGITTRDQIIGNIYENVDNAFLNKGDALYDIKKAGSKNAQGGFYEVDSKIWKDDEEAFPKFQATIEGSPSLMTDMNIQYKDLPQEERMQALYDDYKKSRETYKKDVKSYAAPEKEVSSDSGAGAGVGIETYVLRNGVRGLSLANIKKQMVPMTVTVPARGKQKEKTITIIPSEIYEKQIKNDKGNVVGTKWFLKGAGAKHAWEELSEAKKKEYGTKEDYDRTLATGQTYTTEIYPSIASKLKASYGIDKNYAGYFNNNETSESDPLGIK